MADAFWTEAKIEQMRELWVRGVPTQEIAYTIKAVSKDSVIGKAKRLGFPVHAAAKCHMIGVRSRELKTSTPKPKRVYLPAGVTAQRRAPPKLPPTIAPGTEAVLTLPKANEPLSTSRLLSLFDLPTFGMCRWPLGDPQQTGFAFCGADCAITRVYCPAHHQLSMPRVKPAERQVAA